MTDAAPSLIPNIMARVAVRGGVETIDLLPPAGRVKLETLGDRKDAAHAALMRVTEQHRAAHIEFTKARTLLAKFEAASDEANRPAFTTKASKEPPAWDLAPDRSARPDHRVRPLSHAEMTAERRDVEKLQRTVNRLKTEVDRLTDEWQCVAGLERALREYVEKTLVGAAIRAAAPVVAKVAKDRSLPDAVAEIRGEIEVLRAEVETVTKAPYPSAETKARMAEMVDALAELGCPDIKASVRHAAAPKWRETHCPEYRAGGVNGTVLQFDSVALMAWMFPDVMKAALDREVDKLSDDAKAVPASERPKRKRDLAARILDAERREERVIEIAAERGEMIHRRADADPRAVLGLADHLPGPSE